MEDILYFAYGSNINLEQMAHRCSDAQIVGPVTLENYELQFRGSGFATVAPKEGSVVHGLLWKLTPESEQALDRYEGYPRHYTKEQVPVRTADGASVSVMVYIMAEPMCRQPALPYPSYYRAIQQGDGVQLWRERRGIQAITVRSSKALKQTVFRWRRWRKRGTGPSTRCGAAKWTGPKRETK